MKFKRFLLSSLAVIAGASGAARAADPSVTSGGATLGRIFVAADLGYTVYANSYAERTLGFGLRVGYLAPQNWQLTVLGELYAEDDTLANRSLGPNLTESTSANTTLRSVAIEPAYLFAARNVNFKIGPRIGAVFVQNDYSVTQYASSPTITALDKTQMNRMSLGLTAGLQSEIFLHVVGGVDMGWSSTVGSGNNLKRFETRGYLGYIF